MIKCNERNLPYGYKRAHNKNIVNETKDPFDPTYRELDKNTISSIDPVDAQKNICKIFMKNDAVYAGRTFYPGDIVEICPCKVLEFSYLADFVKEFVFALNDNKYVMPFGYAQYYYQSTDYDKSNCDYKYDAIANKLVITAIKKISRGDRLMLCIADAIE